MIGTPTFLLAATLARSVCPPGQPNHRGSVGAPPGPMDSPTQWVLSRPVESSEPVWTPELRGWITTGASPD
jgi:hypothetical protein